MVDTLSQNEISALLSALSTDADDEEESQTGATTSVTDTSNELHAKTTRRHTTMHGDEVDSSDEELSAKRIERKYDFRRQTKFSKEQLNTIQLIHEAFARLVGTDLSTILRAYAQANIISVEQRTFEELIHSIYNPTFITIFRSDNLDGKAFLDLNLNIVFTILDRLLGGNGAPLGVLRQLTEVEKQIMQKIMFGIIDRLREAWINIIDLAPDVELIESNPQFAQIVPPGEIVLSITIEIKIHDVSGVMTLCVPYNTVEPVVHKFNAASWFAAVRKEPMQTNVEAIDHQVRKVSLPVVAEVGRVVATLEDILSLQPGDIIMTDQLVNDDLTIRVGNMKKFLGRPGILGKKMAVSLTEVLEISDKEFDEEEAD